MESFRKIGISILASLGLVLPLSIVLTSAPAKAEFVYSCESTLVPAPNDCTDDPAPDPDQTFTVELGSNVNGVEVGDADNDGIIDLTTSIDFTFYQAYDITDVNIGDVNVWVFTADVTLNMDSDVIDSARVSALGFNTGAYCPEVVTESGCEADPDTLEELLGVGGANGEFDTRAVSSDSDWIFGYAPNWLDGTVFGDSTAAIGDVLYDEDREGSFPNQFGEIDVCFTMGNSCQGGQSGGVWLPTDGTLGANGIYSGSASFTFVLAFAGSLASNPSIALSKFGVRYQSLDSQWYGWDGDSGTGTQIPEPGSLALLGFGLVGLGAARRRRKSRIQ